MKPFEAVLLLTPRPPTEKPPAPLSDPLATKVTHALMLADQWRDGSTLELTRSDARISLRAFLPEVARTGKQHDAEKAQAMRRTITTTLMAERCKAIFTDALWCERGTKGWAVVARAQQ